MSIETIKPAAPNGRLITFEGGEGAGKSTQRGRLAARLRRLGHTVVETREPGGSPGAEIVRTAILSGNAKPFGPFAEALLFAAARADHLEQTIRPALRSGAIVLCDRFADSTRVYQTVFGQVPDETLLSLERLTVAGTRPDLTLLLDLPVEEGAVRLKARGAAPDRFEGEPMERHRAIREGFLAIAAKEPGRIAVIDASGDEDLVERAIWQTVENRLLGATAQPDLIR